MFTEEEKKFLQAELTNKIAENMIEYSSYSDLSSEDVLRMDILRKINPGGFELLKNKVEEMILKAEYVILHSSPVTSHCFKSYFLIFFFKNIKKGFVVKKSFVSLHL